MGYQYRPMNQIVASGIHVYWKMRCILTICTGNRVGNRSIERNSPLFCFVRDSERSGSPWSNRSSSPGVTGCEINLGLPRAPLSPPSSWPCSLSSSTSASRFFSVYDTLPSSTVSFFSHPTRDAGLERRFTLGRGFADYCTPGFTTSRTLLDRTRELCINERLET